MLRQGGAAYQVALIIASFGLLAAAVVVLPHTLVETAALLRAQYGLWLPLVLPAALLPVAVLHEAAHVVAVRAAGLPVRVRLAGGRGRLPAFVTDVPVALPRRVALAAALAPQPVVLGALVGVARMAPAMWPLCLAIGVLAVAGSAGDLLSAAALACSREREVVRR